MGLIIKCNYSHRKFLSPFPPGQYVGVVFGFLNINKPQGPTSHDMVDRIRRLLPHKPGAPKRLWTKAGHAGTLDPFAQGVLVICVGPAARLVDFVQAQPKQYRATITFGAVSSTDDIAGKLAPTGAAPCPEQAVREALLNFSGAIQQVPPSHSAVQVNGRRAYKMARGGEEVQLAARTVTIHSLRLLSYTWPTLELDIACEGGTYIRALARDLGAVLGVGGYCSTLVRTRVGVFTLESARHIEDIEPSRDMINPLVVLGDMPRVALDAEGTRQIILGRTANLPHEHPCGRAALLNDRGELIALGTVTPGGKSVLPNKVFAAP